ncbi:MAG: hypothetical protein ACHQ53_12860 [Polyangiales bacterium]
MTAPVPPSSAGPISLAWLRRPDAWLLLVAVATACAIVVTYGRDYPVSQWLLVREAGYFILASLWGAGCLSLGVRVLALCMPPHYRTAERIFIGFALGVLAFGLAVFGVGLFGGLGLGFFVLAPLFFLAAGFGELRRLLRRRPWFREPRVPLGRLELLALALGSLGLLAVYLPLLSPHNLQHDARWYHLPIAQQYASSGRVGPFPEGWFLAAYPHLASLLYAWAMLLPASIVHRLELCAHLELVVFLMTLAATPTVLRRVLPGVRMPLAWTGFFLFPGFLVYDSNLSTGADHIAAVFAPAALLALFPALGTLRPAHCALVGALAGGAALTKYSALNVSLPLLACLGLAAAVSAPRHPRRALLACLASGAAFVLFYAPHWLKNWLWYGDPLYPALHAHFPAHPWNLQAAAYFEQFVNLTLLRPSHDLAGVLESLRVALTLGFRVHEYGFHAEIPTFGFLFAATLYCVPFVSPNRRTLVVYGLGLCAALVWYWTNHRDRYLQACLPWLVVATLATLALAWRNRGLPGRIAVTSLVLVQLACGAGAFFIPSYLMVPGLHPLSHVAALIGAGYQKPRPPRFEPYEEWGFRAWTQIGALLPAHAKVLVHEDRLWLGLDAPVVVDEAAWQAGIRYGEVGSTAAVYETLRRYGVTHVVTGQSHPDGGEQGVAGHLVFWDLLYGHAKQLGTRGKLTLWQLPPTRPEAELPGLALLATCHYGVPSGIYVFGDIGKAPPSLPLPAAPQTLPAALFGAVRLVAFEANCGYTPAPEALAGFSLMTQRGALSLWRRR